MRTFSHGRLSRAIAHIVLVTFLWSFGLSGLAAAPAAAQIPTRAATTQSVAVVPFENLTRLRPETLGDDAGVAVAVELRDRLLLDVLPSTDITLQMGDLGMVAPLSDVELVRLAAELDIALVVTGQVRAARIGRGPEGRYGEVALAVRLFDRVARADVNGALVLATGPASPDASEESLVEKALEQAAFEAVEQMRSRPTITAMVLWAKAENVFLNVGTQGGLQPGMEMVAIRGGERIGKVVIDRADAIGSEGTITEGPPLRAGDHLRAIYELPRDFGPVLEISPAKKKSYKSLLTAAGLLLGLGLGSFGSKTRLLGEGNIAAPAFKTSNLANGTELGYPAWDYPAVLLTWEPLSGPESVRVVGYVLEVNGRSLDVIPLVTPFDPNQDHWIHTYVPYYYGWGTMELDTVTGDVWVSESNTDEWDPAQDPPDEFLEHDVDSLDWQFRLDIAPVCGITHRYTLRPILIKQVQVSQGIFEWEFWLETESTDPIQQIIPVTAPFAEPYHYVFVGYTQGVYEDWVWEPNPEIVGNTGTFYFYAPCGADEMIFQITRDPNFNFDPATTVEAIVQGEWTPFVENAVIVDLSAVPGTSDLYWWRFGAHNRRNDLLPRPWPPQNPNDYDWVFSDRNSFSLSSGGRQALRQQERDLLTRMNATSARSPLRSRGDRVLRAD